MSTLKVLFVDDDPNMLAGLQRLVRPFRHEWTMRFATSGRQALVLLGEEHFHAIVTDMRMPDMDGGQLLAEVRKRHPDMVRLILSGYSEAEAVMRTIGLAHQFIAKPCPPQQLIDILNRSLALRRLLDSESLRGLLAGIKTLPTPPETYLRLITYLGDPNASFSGAASIIERDVAMTAELLKLTNSAYFALPARIGSPLQAIRILGLEVLRSVVLQVGIFQKFRGKAREAQTMEAVNRDSFRVAEIARRIARLEGFDARAVEDCFCAGMLCSIGALVLLDCLPDQFDQVRARVQAGEDLIDAEIAELGATHFQVGAYLLGLWGFRHGIVEAVAYVDCPDTLPTNGFDVVGAVHVARSLAGPFPGFAADAHDEAGRLALAFGYLESVG